MPTGSIPIILCQARPIEARNGPRRPQRRGSLGSVTCSDLDVAISQRKRGVWRKLDLSGVWRLIRSRRQFYRRDAHCSHGMSGESDQTQHSRELSGCKLQHGRCSSAANFTRTVRCFLQELRLAGIPITARWGLRPARIAAYERERVKRPGAVFQRLLRRGRNPCGGSGRGRAGRGRRSGRAPSIPCDWQSRNGALRSA